MPCAMDGQRPNFREHTFGSQRTSFTVLYSEPGHRLQGAPFRSWNMSGHGASLEVWRFQHQILIVWEPIQWGLITKILDSGSIICLCSFNPRGNSWFIPLLILGLGYSHVPFFFFFLSQPSKHLCNQISEFQPCYLKYLEWFYFLDWTLMSNAAPVKEDVGLWGYR